MKTGIITLTGVNYGNRLQNYAVQEMIHRVTGQIPDTFNNPYDPAFNPALHRIKHLIKLMLGNKEAWREAVFDRFDKRYIHFTDIWLNREEHRARAAREYDCFVCGSDQVWNPTSKNFGANNFAVFGKNKKRVSLSASFGVDSFPQARVEEYRGYLEGFDYVSVREKSGGKIIKELTGRDCAVLIDPTLMLNEEQWIKLERKPRWHDGRPYALGYFLGKETVPEEISSIIEKEGLNFLNVLELKKVCGPSEFLWLVRNSRLVVTDSFHGTVFAFLYERPMVILRRRDNMENMNTRLENITELFSLAGRMEENLAMEKLFDCDYSEGKKRLEQQREKAFDFLRESLLEGAQCLN